MSGISGINSYPGYMKIPNRSIKINNSNNTFFINYRGKNKSVKINPGDYTLTELTHAIQKEVNKLFGIGNVKINLTGSGSDRLVQVSDSKI